MDLQLFKYSALSSSSSVCISHNVLIKCALLGVNYNLHHHTAITPATTGEGGVFSCRSRTVFALFHLLSAEAPKVIPLPKERWCSRSFPSRRGPRRPHDPHGIISCVCVCVCQRAAASLLDRCFFKKKVFSFCGFGGLSLPLGPQYNHQRLQAAPLPGMECSSQGCYYFRAQLSGRQTQHLNNLVYEACDSKMNLHCNFALLHIGSPVLQTRGRLFKNTQISFYTLL